ncbi:hypothetical protein LNQ49_19285 [Flavobacterium sp. F-65]|uniref:Collagen-like protein n=1 Tax=Flavobacterium pisciphilum TaxID=2893755 RepID=A0ABS8MYA9_9FLAO|nr:hypothetical protein [Flavobacterium sp. F-65]MCC9073728.1 hypothetical protein [Flavobacterium sp. F-65]
MKKIITLFAIIGLVAFSSCEGPEGPVGPPGFDGPPGSNTPLPQTFEVQNVNLGSVNGDPKLYSIYSTFQFEIKSNLFDDETILIYRLAGATSSGLDVWELIPRTNIFPNGDILNYNFDFSKVDFTIYANGNYNLASRPTFVNNQTFRFVIVPSDFLKASVNKNNYSEVMSALNLKESQVQLINL